MIPLGSRFRVARRRADYRPAPPDCADCDDQRFILDARNQTARPCHCAGAYQAAQEAAATPPDRRLTAASGSFDALNPDGPPGADNYRDVYQITREYAANPSGALTIAGPAGVGKTALAVAIGNQILESGWPTQLTSAGAVLRALRQETNANATETASPAAAYRRQRNLIVDDVPLTPATAWEHELLLNFLAERNDARLPSVYVLRGRPELASPDIGAKLCRNDADHRTLCITGTAAIRLERRPPAHLANQTTFDNFRTDHAPQQLNRPKQFAAQWGQRPNGWVCITGPTGVGKTHLAVAAANLYQAAGGIVWYDAIANLVAELRSAAGANTTADPLLPPMYAPMLILDDLGAVRHTPFVEEQINRLLGHRYDRRLPTLLTTNLSIAQIARSNPRLASRLSDASRVKLLHIDTPDYRANASA